MRCASNDRIVPYMYVHQYSRIIPGSLLILSALLLSIPDTALAQTSTPDPTRAPIPFEALLAKGQQSAVRVLAHMRIQIGSLTKRAGRGPGREIDVINIGSGVRFGVANRVLTALAVVAGSDSIEVQIGNRRMPAVLLGADPFTGLALLSVNELLYSNEPPQPALKPAERGDVVVLADPLGERTILHGGEVKSVLPTGLIVTTLPVYGGLSGAPLLNPGGEVVGVVAYAGNPEPGQSGSGSAVAVTADLAMHVATELEGFGRVRWGYFGAEMDPATSDRIMLLNVDEDGPAELAGLRSGDAVTHYGGEELEDPAHLRELVLTTVPGTAVPVKVMRDTMLFEATLIVGDRRAVMPRPAATGLELRSVSDLASIARWRELIEGFNRLFAMPGFDQVRSNMTSLIMRLEQDLHELEQASRTRRPPPD